MSLVSMNSVNTATNLQCFLHSSVLSVGSLTAGIKRWENVKDSMFTDCEGLEGKVYHIEPAVLLLQHLLLYHSASQPFSGFPNIDTCSVRIEYLIDK